MKKIFAFGLMAALVCGISMSIASCKDDNDSKSEEQQAEEQKAQATKALKFYDVVSHLADLSAMDDATYESQTFEPIIGEESQNDPLTRVVATNNMPTTWRRLPGASPTSSVCLREKGFPLPPYPTPTATPTWAR